MTVESVEIGFDGLYPIRSCDPRNEPEESDGRGCEGTSELCPVGAARTCEAKSKSAEGGVHFILKSVYYRKAVVSRDVSCSEGLLP